MSSVKEILEGKGDEQQALPAALKGCSISQKAVTVTCGHKHIISEQYVGKDVCEIIEELEEKWCISIRRTIAINGGVEEVGVATEDEQLCATFEMEAGDHLVLVEED